MSLSVNENIYWVLAIKYELWDLPWSSEDLASNLGLSSPDQVTWVPHAATKDPGDAVVMKMEDPLNQDGCNQVNKLF